MQASCLCQAVRLRFARIVGDYVYCHCRSCRKASGSAFGANVSVPVDELQVDGADNIGVYESSPGKRRHFCRACASPLYTLVGEHPTHARVRLGALDSDFEAPPAAHIFVGYKAPWHRIDAGESCFDEWPDPGALVIAGSRQTVADDDGEAST